MATPPKAKTPIPHAPSGTTPIATPPPLARREGAERVKKRNVFTRHGEKARAVLNALLDKYADGGIASVESLEILKVDPLTTFGTPVEIVEFFGGRPAYLAAIPELEAKRYERPTAAQAAVGEPGCRRGWAIRPDSRGCPCPIINAVNNAARAKANARGWIARSKQSLLYF